MKKTNKLTIILLWSIILLLILIKLIIPSKQTKLFREYNENKARIQIKTEQIRIDAEELQNVKNRNEEIRDYFMNELWIKLEEDKKKEITGKEETSDEVIMNKICELWQINWKKSPLCNNKELYNKFKQISLDKWVDFWLMLWITYAESHIWANYLPSYCWSLNNWAWMKWVRTDEWKMLWGKFPDERWCRLYHFKDKESWWKWLANNLKYWYIERWCSTPECINEYWVWKKSQRWINAVNKFYKL